MDRARGWGRDERGSVMVISAVVLMTLLSISALAIDLGNARQRRSQAQAAVDSGSLAGAQDLDGSSGQHASARARAASYLAETMSVGDAPAQTSPESCVGNRCSYQFEGDISVEIETPYTMASSTVSPDRLIYVRTCRPNPDIFSVLVRGNAPTVCREAVARHVDVASSFSSGIIALDPHGCKSLTIGGSVNVDVGTNGAVVVVSDAAPPPVCPGDSNGAMVDTGTTWALNAGHIAVGGESNLGCATCASVYPTDYAPTGGDPFAVTPVEPPAPGGPAMDESACTAFDPAIDPVLYPAGLLCQPGLYNELDFNSNTTYYFDPGLYYMAGDFKLTRTTTNLLSNPLASSADGPTFYMSPATACKKREIQFTGGTTDLNPPASNPYRGITFFVSRSLIGCNYKFNGNGVASMGSIYAANSHVEYEGNPSAVPGHPMITGGIIAFQVTLSGNGAITVQTTNETGMPPMLPDIGLED